MQMWWKRLVQILRCNLCTERRRKYRLYLIWYRLITDLSSQHGSHTVCGVWVSNIDIPECANQTTMHTLRDSTERSRKNVLIAPHILFPRSKKRLKNISHTTITNARIWVLITLLLFKCCEGLDRFSHARAPSEQLVMYTKN